MGIQARLGGLVDALYRWLTHNRFTRLPWAVIQTFSKAQGALLSGSMAYYTFLSLLPLLMVLGFILGTISSLSLDVRSGLSSALDRIFPGVEGAELIEQLIGARTAFGIFGFIAVAYGGSGFVGALTACLNRMWDVPAGRNPLGQKLVNILIITLLGLVLLGSTAATLWVSYLARVIFQDQAAPALRVIDVAAGPALMSVALLLLYKMLPARSLLWRRQIPGAIFAAVGIELIKRVFALWAQYSAGVSVLPRSILSAVLLLIWLGFMAQLILYGAALNVVLERRRAGEPVLAADPLAEVHPQL